MEGVREGHVCFQQTVARLQYIVQVLYSVFIERLFYSFITLAGVHLQKIDYNPQRIRRIGKSVIHNWLRVRLIT